MKKVKKYIKGKAAVFIDVSNIYYSQQTMGWHIDYEKLYKLFQYETNLAVAYFYSGIVSNNQSQHKFFKKMKKFGYVVKTKEVKWIKDRKSKILKGKGNLDIELALDMSQQIGKYHTAILLSGDSDFVPVVQFAIDKKRKVVVISSRGHVAKELIQAATTYIPFESIRALVERKKSPPTKRGDV